MKTPYSSFCLNKNGIARGCKFCVKGEKLVIFISGRCSRNCWYCSLSKKRKSIDKIWANEREIKNTKELIEEAKESRATSAGITGGDPLLFLSRTIKYAKVLKSKFGNKFHIHIYLPTKLVTKEKLRKLSKYIDEVRFHPEFLINASKEKIKEDIEKIRLASLYWNKQNIGIELPLIPEKKKQILEFVLKVKDFIGFVNLNEFELSETNFEIVTKKYKLKEGGYVIAKSKEAGLWILKQLKRKKVKLNVHLCTAELKNCFQYKNRLLRHKILLYQKRTKEGTVVCFVVKDKNYISKLKNKKGVCYDKVKNRLILSEGVANELLNKVKIYRIEEYPTFDREEVEVEEIC